MHLDDGVVGCRRGRAELSPDRLRLFQARLAVALGGMAEKDAETRHWFTKCRAAMLSEAPKVIQDTLADAEQLPDGGDSVQAERRQLEERLSTLVRKAVQEMRSLGRSKDFKAVELALMKYGDYPKESDNDPWDVLQAHREDLVRAAKKRLRDVALVSDPVLLGRELEHLVGVPCALTARVCVSVYLSERVADDGPQLQLPW